MKHRELRMDTGPARQGQIFEDVVLGIGGVRSVKNLLLCDVIDQHDTGSSQRRVTEVRHNCHLH